MHRATLIVVLVGCGPTAAVTSSTTPSVTVSETPEALADNEFLEQWAETHGFRNGQPTSFRFSPDGADVFFLRSGPRDSNRALYALNVESGEERQVLTAEQLLDGAQEELSAEERALRERLRMSARGITSFQLSPDGSSLLIPLSGRLFIFDRESSETKELPSEGGYANSPRMSPDGTKVACVREGELYVIDIARGRQRQLTRGASETLTHGLAEFVAQEEMSRYRGFWWSPDSNQILYQQNESSDVEVLYASNPIDPSERPHGARYPRAGTDNVAVKLGIISVTGGSTKWVEWDRESFPYLTTVRWPSDAPLTLVVQDRLQQNAHVLTVNVQTGQTQSIHHEQDDAWLNID